MEANRFMKNNHDLFYCYNPKLARFLKCKDGTTFLTKARHLETNNIFYLFVVNDKLQHALEEFKAVSQ
jgi:hypothetical protein